MKTEIDKVYDDLEKAEKIIETCRDMLEQEMVKNEKLKVII